MTYEESMALDVDSFKGMKIGQIKEICSWGGDPDHQPSTKFLWWTIKHRHKFVEFMSSGMATHRVYERCPECGALRTYLPDH